MRSERGYWSAVRYYLNAVLVGVALSAAYDKVTNVNILWAQEFALASVGTASFAAHVWVLRQVSCLKERQLRETTIKVACYSFIPYEVFGGIPFLSILGVSWTLLRLARAGSEWLGYSRERAVLFAGLAAGIYLLLFCVMSLMSAWAVVHLGIAGSFADL